MLGQIYAVQSWNLGCSACESSLSITTSGQNAGYHGGNGASESVEMWLDGCDSVGSTYDISHKGTGFVKLRNWSGGYRVRNEGLIEWY